MAQALGARWWFHFGKALSEVIMPEDFYKIGPAEKRQFDNIGLCALQKDLAAWSGEPSDDSIQRSEFNLFYDIAKHLFGSNSGQALDYAMYVMERRQPLAPKLRPPDPQKGLPFGI